MIPDDLLKDFATVIEEQNRVQKNFGSFFLTISKLADMKKAYQPPLSKTGKIVECMGTEGEVNKKKK